MGVILELELAGIYWAVVWNLSCLDILVGSLALELAGYTGKESGA